MGQYYRVVLESDGNLIDRTVYQPLAFLTDEDGVRFIDLCGAKLTEHSSIGNPFSDGIANVLFTSTNPLLVSWVGDYSKDVAGGAKFYRKAYGTHRSSVKAVPVEGCEFDYTGKFLLNYTKGEFVSYDRYLANVKSNWKKWSPYNPLALLTAVGNGLGGGDYYGENRCEYSTYGLIGRWAGDLIKIRAESPYPADMWTEIFPQFVEYASEEELEELKSLWDPDWRLSHSAYIEWCKKNDCLDKPLKQRRLELEGNIW